MDVSIVGAGYVGTTAAACLADAGHRVVAIDTDASVVDAINDGEAPIHEPGLDELVAAHAGDRLTATTAYAAVAGTDVTLLALPTPSAPDGAVDTSIIEAGADAVGEALAGREAPHTVAVKSTVLPGVTAARIGPRLGAAEGVHLATNPEFLREGTAVGDFTAPTRIVIGADSDRAADRLEELYAPIVEAATPEPTVLRTTLPAGMMIKYANNAFLAGKISLINDIGNICKAYGVDAYEVAEAIGLDDRIGRRFLRSGVGFGGSCFPKDLDALRHAARAADYEPTMLDATVETNDRQPERLLELLDRHVDPAGERIAVLGLAFKPGTDDVRHSRAFPVIEGLQDRGAEVVAYDPVATANARAVAPGIEYADSAAAALSGAGGAVVVTDWDEFAALDAAFDAMARPVVVDGRRIIERREGITYEGLTW